MRKVREEMGLTNVEIMVPFVRTLEEARQVVELLARNGLERGRAGLRVIMMCEIPSNAVLADRFLEYFDGFSIGSNDMTQLTLGLDRDSGIVAGEFDERDPAVKQMLHLAIQAVTDAVTSMRLNTAIAAMMAFVNEATKATSITPEQASAFVRILAPFAPHIAEELWQRLGHEGGITYAPWPAFDESKTKADMITVAVQVNGKRRDELTIARDAAKEDIEAAALKLDNVVRAIGGRKIKKVVVVPQRIVNVVA